MSKLYELTGKYLAVAEMADDPNMPPEAIADTLESIEGEIEVKAESILQVVRGWETDTAAIDDEIKRLQARKSVIQNRSNSLRDYLFRNMIESGIDKISCPLFQITLAKPRPLAVIENEDSIPDSYVNVVTTRKPDKAAILKTLKAGKEVPGCVLGESKRALLIR